MWQNRTFWYMKRLKLTFVGWTGFEPVPPKRDTPYLCYPRRSAFSESHRAMPPHLIVLSSCMASDLETHKT